MRVSGKSLLKVSTGVPTTSNVGPASSWNAVIAMGVLEYSHSAVSAEVRMEHRAVCRDVCGAMKRAASDRTIIS